MNIDIDSATCMSLANILNEHLAGLKAGDHVRLGLKKRGVFLFDRETGERIR